MLEITSSTLPDVVIEAIAYDMGGNFESDEIEDPENFYYNQFQVNSKKIKNEISKSIKTILYNLEGLHI